MNPLCPNCQTELTDDFGLVDCKSCGAVCSIDLEDNVSVQGDELADYQGETSEENTEILGEDEGELDENEGSDESEDEESEVYEDSEPDESDEENDDLDYNEYESNDPDVEEDVEDADAIAEEDSEDDSDPEEGFRLSDDEPVVAAPLKRSKPLNGEDFLKDLEVFSDEATADGGHIYYDFHVTGIEGGQQREFFIETLADARLEISEDAVREILGDSAVFTLPQISFLRLTVIYKRLLSLGLEMSWSLSELQEPISYLSEEIEEVDLYGDEDSAVYEESDEENY